MVRTTTVTAWSTNLRVASRGTSLSMRIAAFAILPLLLSLTCVDKGPPTKKIDKAYIQANLLTAVPTDLDNEVAVDFDGKVQYLGNQVGTKVLTPGGAGSIVHYWKVVEPPGADWKIFAHLNGSASELMNLDATDMRTGYPSSKWKAGDIIRDEQKFTLGKSWVAKTATLSVGLYRKGGQGVQARMPIKSGPQGKDRRAQVFQFSVPSGGATPPRDATYLIRKAKGPITLDGKADEESWKNAPMSPNFTDTEGGSAVGASTQARLLWDDEFLYAFVQVADPDVYSEFTKRDDTLWKQDVVELFIDADRNRRGYIELQVNPNNAHFDAWFPKTRGQTHHFEWNSSMKSSVLVHGSNDNRGDTDQGWDVEIAIPLADVKGMDTAMKIKLPPQLGDTWRLNIVRGEKPKNKGLAASSWNPITINDFHALGRMLNVVFADSEGAVKTEPTPGADAGAGADAAAASEGAPATEDRGQTRKLKRRSGATESPTAVPPTK